MKLKPNPQFLKDVPAKDRKRWHDALLRCRCSQARNIMVDGGGGYCCLMVGHEEWGGTDEQRSTFEPTVFSPFSIAMQGPVPVITSDLSDAVTCNDSLGLTFAEIAALVYPEATEET